MNADTADLLPAPAPSMLQSLWQLVRAAVDPASIDAPLRLEQRDIDIDLAHGRD